MEGETVQVTRFAGGKPSGGKLCVGAIAASGLVHTKASIPNRFETVLNTGVRENNAFGRRTYRFDEPENDLPGPGSYGRGKSSVLRVPTNFSKKGSAAFASAQKAGFPEDAPVPMLSTPGPGAYSLSDWKKAANQKGSPAFVAPVPKPLTKLAKPNLPAPGPGSYPPPDTWKSVPCAAGASKAIRDGFVLAEKGLVGPGEYQTARHLDSCVVRNPARPSSFIASTTTRFGDRHREAVKLPPSVSQRDATNNLIVSVLSPQQQREVSPPRSNSPIATAPRATSPKHTAAFAETNLDRFGRCTTRFSAQEPSDVGPGAYYNPPQSRRLLISSSWALSGVPRGGQDGDRYKVPGPCYYNPHHTAPLSHHIPSKTWL
jgi:hypothetical protein